jgi:hypothetical protein
MQTNTTEIAAQLTRTRPHSPLGVQIARTILSGDVQAARELVWSSGRNTWSPAELRAICTAVQVANTRWSADLDPYHFLNWR